MISQTQFTMMILQIGSGLLARNRAYFHHIFTSIHQICLSNVRAVRSLNAMAITTVYMQCSTRLTLLDVRGSTELFHK